MKVCIVHFRMGLTDGVSLEIDKRITLLKELGHSVITVAGTKAGNADLQIPYFEYKSNPDVIKIDKLAFTKGASEEELKQLTEKIASEIEKQITDLWEKEQFTHMFIHNIFSLPVCLPATVAFYNFLKKHPQIKAVGIYHDFWWDPARLKRFTPENAYAKKILNEYFPPDLSNISHWNISKWEQNNLKKQRGMDSFVITDTFNFDQPLWVENDENKDFLSDIGLAANDIIFLHATRVRARKAVEISIDFIAEISRMKKELVGKKKYNGAEITAGSKIVLLLPGEFTDKEQEYIDALEAHASKLHVDIRWIEDLVGSDAQKENGTRKYGLWDCYVYSDFVLYPSIWEGWGNQFIEAVFAKKPVAAFEYEVFKTDIGPVGFDVIRLGDTYTTDSNNLVHAPQEKLHQAAQETIDLLLNKEKYYKVIEHNFDLGKRTHNTNIQLKKHLEDTME